MARYDRKNLARYWHHPDVPDLALMRADFSTHSFAAHVHEAFVVAVTEAGGAEIKSRGEVGQAHVAALYAFNPGEPHAGWMGASPRWRYRGFYLGLPGMRLLAESLGIERLPYFTRNAFGDPDLIRSFLALHDALEAAEDPVLGRELLVASFGELFLRHGAGARPPAPAGTDRPLFERALGTLRDRMTEALTLEQIGTETGLTVFQLIGLFKRVVGLSPHQYLTQLRLREARRRLAGGQTLAEAALASGFYDQSALHKHFKRSFGITPLQFAEAARGSGFRRAIPANTKARRTREMVRPASTPIRPCRDPSTTTTPIP